MVRFSETVYLEVSGEVRRHMRWQKLPTPRTAGLRVLNSYITRVKIDGCNEALRNKTGSCIADMFIEKSLAVKR